MKAMEDPLERSLRGRMASRATRSAIAPLAAACLGLVPLVAAHADVIPGTGEPGATTLGQTTATQIRVDSQGTGHGLIVPYFTTQNGAITLLNVSNTDRANGKLVKVRIRGAANGDVLLSLTLLLAPGDMWAASLRRRESGHAALFAHPNDRTCTLPSLQPIESEPLRTDRLAVSYSPEDLANQTREGLVEYINMADIPAAAMYGASRQSQSELFRAIKHVGGVAPCGAVLGRLDENFTSETLAAELGLAAPTGGLAGRWIIMNVSGSLTFTGPMHAVRAVDAGGMDARANFVQFPQTDVPYALKRVNGATADPLLRTQAYPGKNANGAATQVASTGPAVRALHLDFPDFSTPYTVAPGPDAALAQATQFTDALAVKTAANEHLMTPAVDFRTDWVVSLPARRFSVAMDHTIAEPRLLYSMVPGTGNQYFHDTNMRASDTDKNVACVVLPQWPKVVNRDGKVELRDITVSPHDRLYRGTCGAVAVYSFVSEVTTADPLEPRSVLAATATRSSHSRIIARSVEGFTTLDFFTAPTNLGLPVVASAFSSALNPAARPGVLANYGMNSEHLYTR